MRRPGSVLLALLSLAAVSLAHAGGLEGRWRLIEQHYGSGQANMADTDAPVRLEFAREGGSLTGRIWAGESAAQALPWPALVTAGEARPVQLELRLFDAREEQVTTRYRVAPSPGDDLVLVVTEEYRVEDGGSALAGTVHVAFRRDGAPRGEYTLHRRFEREP